MTSADPADADFVYDEFAYLHENVTEFDLAAKIPPVRRAEHPVGDGRILSGLAWGEDTPEIVYLHGTGQNAHTWDTVALATSRPALAVDLPGHGYSSWRDDRAYDPRNMADDVAEVVRELAPNMQLLVGMSLGGLVANAVAARHPELVPSLLVVDITPGVTREKAKHIHDFIEGPPDFPSFSEIFDRTVQFNPTRTKESLRRGIIHNAQRQPDGSWQWRYDRRGRAGDAPAVDRAGLWDDVDSFDDDLQYMLARGGGEGSVVDDADVEELIGRRPSARVEIVRDAGHSIQGDQPLALAAIIDALLDDTVL